MDAQKRDVFKGFLAFRTVFGTQESSETLWRTRFLSFSGHFLAILVGRPALPAGRPGPPRAVLRSFLHGRAWEIVTVRFFSLRPAGPGRCYDLLSTEPAGQGGVTIYFSRPGLKSANMTMDGWMAGRCVGPDWPVPHVMKLHAGCFPHHHPKGQPCGRDLE